MKPSVRLSVPNVTLVELLDQHMLVCTRCKCRIPKAGIVKYIHNIFCWMRQQQG